MTANLSFGISRFEQAFILKPPLLGRWQACDASARTLLITHVALKIMLVVSAIEN